MNQKDLERAFGSNDRENWTESQRRVAMYFEYSERTIQSLQRDLASYKEAAAIQWLRDVNASLKPVPYNPAEDDS